jgi:hypothetical protein
MICITEWMNKLMAVILMLMRGPLVHIAEVHRLDFAPNERTFSSRVYPSLFAGLGCERRKGKPRRHG